MSQFEDGRVATIAVPLAERFSATDNVRRVAAMLCARQRELNDRLSRLNRDVRRENDPLVQDFFDQAVQRQNDEVIDRLRALTAWELDQIDSALAQIAAGSYGCCERCGQSIDHARLQAMPHAPLCQRCARSLEPRARTRAAP
jgi:RNA polymerase-binding transcription factor DksA